jgi:dTDP-glucose 4,6-dehydratase/UDP-glucose 4-epimerase
MRILVTGGAGFIGSALVRRLAGEDHEVVALDDCSRGQFERLTGVPCRRIPGDVRDEDAVLEGMQGCDAVIHAAYLQGTQTFYAEPRQVLDVALRGILNVLSACEKRGTPDLLLISSSEAYQVAPTVPTPEEIPLVVPDVQNPRYSYGGGKISSELATLAWHHAGVLDRAIIARPHNVVGPDMGREHVIPEFAIRMGKLVREYRSGIIPFPIQGTGEETRSFCYIDDCVEQLYRLLMRAPEGPSVWHVGNMDERTIADVAHAVAACYGREIKVVPGKLPKGSPPRRLPDTAKIEALGYKAVVPFDEAVRRSVEWYQHNG